MSFWSRIFGDEKGLTLVELLVTIAIIGTAFAALVGGMATSIQVSAVHRKQTTSETLLRTYAEKVKASALTNWGLGCQTAAAYAPGAVGLIVPTGYVASATGVTYWQPSGNSGNFVGPPCSSDTGLQEVSLQVSSSGGAGGGTTQVLQVLVRKP